MNKVEQQKELDELITRFRRLKKAMVEEDTLSPAMRRAAEIADKVRTSSTPLTRERVLAAAKEHLEQQHAQRLANQLQKSGILGGRVPQQPTNEEMQKRAQNMFAQANGFSTQEEMNKAESEWGNNLNDWLVEAQKPINQKFKSKEDEAAYWDKIKVSDNGRGNEGF